MGPAHSVSQLGCSPSCKTFLSISAQLDRLLLKPTLACHGAIWGWPSFNVQKKVDWGQRQSERSKGRGHGERRERRRRGKARQGEVIHGLLSDSGSHLEILTKFLNFSGFFRISVLLGENGKPQVLL